LSERPEAERLDFGCAVSAGSFEVQYGESGIELFKQSGASTALFFFFLTLLYRLQTMGTVPAIDYQSYLAQLHGDGGEAK
jgi:hypothetical protein